MSTGAPIRIGLLGCGDYGRKVQLANLLAMPSVRVAGLYNRSKAPLEAGMKDAKAAGHAPRAFSKWQQLVTDTAIDAVVCALPPAFNWEVVKACEGAGKAVLIEKPVASTLDELHGIEKLSRRRRIHIQVGTQLLWSQFYRRLEQETRALGEVLSVRCEVYHGDGWVLEPMTWKVDRESSGGILNSWGVHPLTMMLKLAGGTPVADHAASDGWEADYDELSAFTGAAFERDSVDAAMYDTVSANWLTLGSGDSQAAVPSQLFYAAHPGVSHESHVWRLQVLCTGGRIEGDVHARTLSIQKRGQPPQTLTLPPITGAGYDGNREALIYFADCISKNRVDLGSLHLAITASRLALDVNVSPNDEDDEDEEDLRDTPRRGPGDGGPRRSKPRR